MAKKKENKPGSITVKNIPRDVYDEFFTNNRAVNAETNVKLSMSARLIELIKEFNKKIKKGGK